MYTVKFTNEQITAFYNENGPSLTETITAAEVAALVANRNDAINPDKCPELTAVFTAQSDFEAAPFTVVNESDYRVDAMDAINAVACLYLRNR